MPPEDIEQAAGPLVAESIRRLRSGSVEMQPGYDGEYGKVKILAPEEIAQYSGQMTFLPGSAQKEAPKKPRKTTKKAARSLETPDKDTQSVLPAPHYGLNDAQWEAVQAEVLSMLELAKRALNEENIEMATAVFGKDNLLDDINAEATGILADYIREHPETAHTCVDLVGVFRKLERSGDHITNIAEEIVFFIDAKVLKHSGKVDENYPKS